MWAWSCDSRMLESERIRDPIIEWIVDRSLSKGNQLSFFINTKRAITILINGASIKLQVSFHSININK